MAREDDARRGQRLRRLARLAAVAALPAVLTGAAAPAPPAGEQPVELALRSAPQPAPAPAPPEVPVVLLVDLSSGQTLFERDADRRFVPASVTKVMTAYTAFRLIEEGRLAEDQDVIVSREVAELWSGEGSTMFLQSGDEVTVGQLLLGVTTVSANDASVMIAMTAVDTLDNWLALMNANAAELGLGDTHFGTSNGWPDEGRTYTSARDMATLAEAMIMRYPDLYSRYFGQRGMSYRNIAQNNHDPVTGRVEGGDGIKTGYTRQAGYTFVGSAQRDGRRLVVVLGGSPTSAMRNRAARDLLNWGFDAFSSEQLLPAQAVIGAARVQQGAQTRVDLHTAAPVLASMAQGESVTPSFAIRYRGPLVAPIAAGEPVAYLRVSIPDQAPHDVPLLAAEDIPRANSWQRLRNGLAGLFS